MVVTSQTVEEVRPRAEAGDADAALTLGNMYLTGEGVAQDHAEAVRWFRLAADQGNADAQVNLGLAYGFGLGIPVDFVMAYMWVNLAASRNEVAVELRDRIGTLLTSEQRAEGQRLALEWGSATAR